MKAGARYVASVVETMKVESWPKGRKREAATASQPPGKLGGWLASDHAAVIRGA